MLNPKLQSNKGPGPGHQNRKPPSRRSNSRRICHRILGLGYVELLCYYHYSYSCWYYYSDPYLPYHSYYDSTTDTIPVNFTITIILIESPHSAFELGGGHANVYFDQLRLHWK